MGGRVRYDIALDPSGFLEHASGAWLDLLASEIYGITRRPGRSRLPRTGLWLLRPGHLEQATSPGGNGMEADGAPFGTPLGSQPETRPVPLACQVIPSRAEDSAAARRWGARP